MGGTIQSVRYPQQDNSPPDWLQGFGYGVGGYLEGQQQKQENLMKLLPYFIQMKQAKAGGTKGTPGYVDIPGFGPMTLGGAPSLTPSDILDLQRVESLKGKNPWAETLAKTYMNGVAVSGRKLPNGQTTYAPDPEVINYIKQNGALPPEVQGNQSMSADAGYIEPGSWATAGMGEKLKAAFTPSASQGEMQRGALTPLGLLFPPKTIPKGVSSSFKPTGKPVTAKTKAQRANELSTMNPNLTKEEILDMINEEYGQ